MLKLTNDFKVTMNIRTFFGSGKISIILNKSEYTFRDPNTQVESLLITEMMKRRSQIKTHD